MRQVIKAIIDESGLASEDELRKDYQEMLRRFQNLTEEEITEITDSNFRDPDFVGKLNHQIILKSKQITDSEIEEIAQYIVDHKPSTYWLSLNNNLLTDEGARKLCQIITNLKHLISLSLAGNDLGEKGFYAVFTLYAKNRRLNLSLAGNKLSEVGFVEQLKWKAVVDYEKLNQ